MKRTRIHSVLVPAVALGLSLFGLSFTSTIRAQTIQIEEIAGKAAQDVPISISFAAGKGEYFGDQIQPVIDGKTRPAQVNVLSTWPDGSVCHAIVNFYKDIKALGKYSVTFNKVRDPLTDPFIPAALLEELQMNFEFKQKMDGKTYRVDFTPQHAYALLLYAWIGDTTYAENVWGQARRDYELRLRPREVVTGDEHPQIEVILRWQLYDQRWAGAFCEVIVENCRTDSIKDDIEFDTAKIKVGKYQKLLADLKDQNLLCQQRFAVQFWAGRTPPQLIIHPDIPYLAKIGLLPPLDHRNPISDGQVNYFIDELMKDVYRGDFDPNEPLGIPLNRGPIFRYQPGTGDRADIGWLPRWTFCAINSSSLKGERITAAGDMNGSGMYPLHNRDYKTGELGLPHNHPFWHDKIKYEPRLDNDHVPNIAHMPILGYVSYLLTGRKLFLEELVCWTAFAHRDWYPNDGMLKHLGSRDGAWALRNSTLTAAIMPDNHPLKAYFKDRLSASADRYVSEMDFTLPLGTFGTGGWRTSGRANWPCGMRDSPWCNAWFSAMCELNDRLHGNSNYKRIYEHNWKYFQKGYAGLQQWKAPSGETIYQDPELLMQYSKCIATYTPKYNDKGEWDVVDGSVVPLSNFAATQWYERIQEDHGWSGKESPPDWPKGGPEARYWRPISGSYSPPEADRYDEYGGGRVAFFWTGELRGLPQAQDVIDVVEPWIQYYLDGKGRPLGMRYVSYFTQ